MAKVYDTFRPLLGVLCFLLGILICFTPLPFGSLVMLTGIIMTSPEVRILRSFLSWLERKDPTKKQWASRIIGTLEIKLIPAPVRARVE